MERFSSLRKSMGFRESKESIIRRIPNLTDEQRREAIDFFDKHNDYEKEIDWNLWRRLTWEDLKAVIDKPRYSKSQGRKHGVKGLEEGKDYLLIADTDRYTVYQPLSHVGAQIIASPSVPPEVEPDDGFEYPNWCISEDGHEYWVKYSAEGQKFFIVCVKDLDDTPIEFHKFSVQFAQFRGNDYITVWDINDINYEQEEGYGCPIAEEVVDNYKPVDHELDIDDPVKLIELLTTGWDNWMDKVDDTHYDCSRQYDQWNVFDDDERLNGILDRLPRGITISYKDEEYHGRK